MPGWKARTGVALVPLPGNLIPLGGCPFLKLTELNWLLMATTKNTFN